MTKKDQALLARSEKRRKADELRYERSRQGRFEKSIKPDLVHPDGTPREISDGGRAVNRMIRALDWAYHCACLENKVRRHAARLHDSTLKRILWGAFKGRDQDEAIRLAKVSKVTFQRGVRKIFKFASRPMKSGKRGTSGK